ncbi:hypothetical protein PGT21_006005 [Puccinia graminis f. sp. tritici]|uniref:Uncharacterized protein n=1 Tax=Puccinia graminis f. sp. tritici TaxID=56615 RepID=A0A5B0NFP3_PUCGR|nr:hypothetical protein PGT21_006005 [Puccinia graminis f. sp. tritici]
MYVVPLSMIAAVLGISTRYFSSSPLLQYTLLSSTCQYVFDVNGIHWKSPSYFSAFWPPKNSSDLW